MVETVRRELDRYSRTRRFSSSLRWPLTNLAFCTRYLIDWIDELEHLVLLWRDVAYRRGPGRKIATRYLSFAFSNLSRGIHSTLAIDKSRIDPRELLEFENVPPEIVAALPAAAKRIAEEGLAFLEAQSQSSKRISKLRLLWLVSLGHLEEFVGDARVGEARGRIVCELKHRLANPRLPHPAAMGLLETLAELAPESEPEPSTIDLLLRIVDHPRKTANLERALYLQVQFGLENMDDANCILDSWFSSLRGSEFEGD